jgi:porin
MPVNAKTCSLVGAAAVILACAGLARGQEALTSVETSGPMDLPGAGPAPKTLQEAQQPPAEQNLSAPAQGPASPEGLTFREGFGPDGKPWTKWGRATGDWGGARTTLEDAGLTISGFFVFNWSSVFSGGVERRAYTRRLLDLSATLDLDKAFGWTGGSAFICFEHYSGFEANAVGSAMGTDLWASSRNVDQIMELWFQQVFADGRLRIKAGKIDANKEFAVLPAGTSFVSANGYWDDNLLGQPTYPDPSTGVVAYAYPNENLFFGFGVFDGATVEGIRTGGRGPATFFSDSQADSWYFAGEAGVTWTSWGDLGSGRIAAGGWGHTADFARLDGSGTKEGTQGGYLIGEQQLTRRGESDELKDHGLFVFARASLADRAVSVIEGKYTVGLSVKGTFDGRDDDHAGVMFSYADISGRSGATRDETNLELFYKLQLFGSVSLTPDIQWIRNPSGRTDIDDAWLGTLSVTVTF